MSVAMAARSFRQRSGAAYGGDNAYFCVSGAVVASTYREIPKSARREAPATVEEQNVLRFEVAVDDLAIQIGESRCDIGKDACSSEHGNRPGGIFKMLAQGLLGTGHDYHPGVGGLAAVDHGDDVADSG
jgi:hypothetical protein